MRHLYPLPPCSIAYFAGFTFLHSYLFSHAPCCWRCAIVWTERYTDSRNLFQRNTSNCRHLEFFKLDIEATIHHVITWPYVIFKPVFLVCSLLWNVLCVVRETRHSCCKIEQKCPEVIEESALAVLQKLVQLNFTVGINMTGVSTAAWVSAIVGTSKGAPQEAEVVNVTGAIVIQVAVADQVVTVGDAIDTITTHLRAIR